MLSAVVAGVDAAAALLVGAGPVPLSPAGCACAPRVDSVAESAAHKEKKESWRRISRAPLYAVLREGDKLAEPPKLQ